jgi:uncharacterized protein YbaR (Trm112 family)
MLADLIPMLECPACHGGLDWAIHQAAEAHILAADIRCRSCGAGYAVRDGIGLFLTPNLPREDLDPWQGVESELMQYLHHHPDVERRLMQVPPDALNPADRFFRALVLEERGRYLEARVVEESALAGLHTAEYLACWSGQMENVIERLAAADGPVVDLASGRCYLVERLAQRLNCPIVACDFSPRVLQRDRQRLQAQGLSRQVSLLAFDARRTPFQKGAVKVLTTNLGLPNIREPGDLLGELRRIAGGTFLAVSHFYPEPDRANGRAIRAAKLETMSYRRTAMEAFAGAGWHVEIANACSGRALPTPDAVVLEGATIDSLPVAETTLEWCVLAATPRPA